MVRNYYYSYLEVLKLKCTRPLKYIAGLYTEHVLQLRMQCTSPLWNSVSK